MNRSLGRTAAVLGVAVLVGCSSGDKGKSTAKQSLRIVSSPVRNAAPQEPLRYRIVPSVPGAEIEAEELPPGAKIDTAGVLTWTPADEQVGERKFVVRARVGEEVVRQEFTVSASRAAVQVQEEVEPGAPDATTVAVTAPLSRVRGAAVQVEPDSLTETTTSTITISELEEPPIPPSARIARVPVSDLKPVELGPSGTAFRKPARVQLPVSASVAQRGRPEVQTYDWPTGRWSKAKVLSFDARQQLVIAEVNHFSTYVATPAVQVIDPKLALGPAGTACADALVVRAPLLVPLADLPASLVNGYDGDRGTIADLLAGMPAGQAVQLLFRGSARTSGGGAEDGWILTAALKDDGGKLRVRVVTSERGTPFLKIPETLSAEDPEVAAFLSGARTHFLFGRLGPLDGEVNVTVEVSAYYTRASDAERPPVQAVNPLATEAVSATRLGPVEAGFDGDCDQAPDAYDPTPDGEAPLVLRGTPPSPVHATVGMETRLEVAAGVTDVTYVWSPAPAALGLSGEGAGAAIKAQLPGVYRVEVVGKKGRQQGRFVWDVIADPPAVMAANTPPVVAIAAGAAVVRVGDPLRLMAIGKDREQAALAYRWSSSDGAMLSTSTGEGTLFVAPAPGDYVVRCVAHDGQLESAPAAITITALSATANRPPSAPRVSPLSVLLTHAPGAPVSVALTAAADDPDGDAVTYTFTPDPMVPRTVSLAPMGPAATVTTAADGLFLFHVAAQDAKGTTGPTTTVRIQVLPEIDGNAADGDRDGYPGGIDCNDAEPRVFPGQREICGDGIDQDCDGRDLGANECDADRDRFSVAQGDCDDRDPARNPGMTERCDGIDNNCNMIIDEGFALGQECAAGVGVCQVAGKTVCSATFSSVVCGGRAREPQPEICDGVDNDCNGRVDDVMAVAAGDVGSCGGCGVSCPAGPNTAPACVNGGCLSRCTSGHVDLDRRPENGCECALTNGGAEICDGLDNDCNGQIDEAVADPFYPGPAGTQGVGVCAAGVRACQAGRLFTVREARLPSPEICDGLDNDCNGKADEIFDLTNDPRNCGGCGVVCAPGTACTGGRCASGQVDAGVPDALPPPPPSTGLPAMCVGADGTRVCTDLSRDSSHCGACGRACPSGTVCLNAGCVAGSATTDTSRAPTGGSCPAPRIGPDGKPICEAPAPDPCTDPRGAPFCTNLGIDNANCGACGRACAQGTACQMGTCMPVAAGCAPSQPMMCNGVCTSTAFDPRNCGACGVACPPGSACEAGRCVMSPATTCAEPMRVCGDPAVRSYCTDPLRDPANCGGCGRVCPSGTYCETGQCVMGPPPMPPQCMDPHKPCVDPAGRGYCTDPLRDPMNCGGCGRTCPAGTMCNQGQCLMTTAPPPTCFDPQRSCTDATRGGTYCTDLVRDPNNCGACGRVCAAGTYCDQSQCVAGPPPSCMAPASACVDPGGRTYCVDLQRDPYNCGACGRPCPAGTVCDLGQCVTGPVPPPTCTAPLTPCMDAAGKSYCSDLQRDSLNCGGCGRACAPGTVCQNGACTSGTPTCGAPAMACPGPNGTFCADVTRDGANCGACGVVCGGGTYCQNGQCTGGTTSCVAPAKLCSDAAGGQFCVDVTKDAANCGDCGRVCPPDTTCQNAACVMGTLSCAPPTRACASAQGGQFCADVTRDSANCGDCGRVCPAGSYCQTSACVSSPPTCTAPLQACPDAAGNQRCVDVTRDGAHCGSCGTACAAGMYCQNGACVPMTQLPTCAAPMKVCLDAAGAERCVDVTRDPAHCGDCGKGCPSGICTNGVCG